MKKKAEEDEPVVTEKKWPEKWVENQDSHFF